MFDIGWQELLVLGAVAMVIFPPREYPELLRGVAGMLHRLRRMGEDVREGIDDFSQKHLSEQFNSIEDAKRSVSSSFGETQKLLRKSAENMRKQIADLESRGKGKVGGKAKKATSKSKTKAQAAKKAIAKTKAQAPKKAPAKTIAKAQKKVTAKAPAKTKVIAAKKVVAQKKIITKVTAKV